MKNTKGRRKFSEVYIRRGSMGEVYGTEVSAAQYYTYTTTRIEKDAVRKYHDAYAKVEEGYKQDWMRLRSEGRSDSDPKVYRELNEIWKQHFDLYRISLSAYITDQRNSCKSDLVFAELVGSSDYVVPVDYSIYESVDF